MPEIRGNNAFAHYAANAANTVRTGPGMLHAVSINTKGATGNTLTIAVDGATLAIIDTTAGPSFYLYDVEFLSSLVATLATGTAADVTISYAPM